MPKARTPSTIRTRRIYEPAEHGDGYDEDDKGCLPEDHKDCRLEDSLGCWDDDAASHASDASNSDFDEDIGGICIWTEEDIEEFELAGITQNRVKDHQSKAGEFIGKTKTPPAERLLLPPVVGLRLYSPPTHTVCSKGCPMLPHGKTLAGNK